MQQIRVSGYPVREVLPRLGLSLHSLCKWMMFFRSLLPKCLAQMTEERDILKKATAYFARESR